MGDCGHRQDLCRFECITVADPCSLRRDVLSTGVSFRSSLPNPGPLLIPRGEMVSPAGLIRNCVASFPSVTS